MYDIIKHIVYKDGTILIYGRYRLCELVDLINGQRRWKMDGIVFTFDSDEEAIAFAQDIEDDANAATLSWQSELKLGNYFVSNFQGLVIYNRIVQTEPLPGEYPFAPNHVLVEAFSVVEPDGELGDAHLVTAERQLTQSQFEKARVLGWPSDSARFLEMLQA